MKALALLLLSSVAFAGTTSTMVGGISVFHPEGTAPAVTYKDAAGKTAHDACQEAAKAYVGKATCSDVFTFTTVGTCADVAKPKWTVEFDANGYLIKPAFRSKFKEGSDTEFVHEVEDYVPSGYPECWVKGWRVAMESDFTDDNDELLASSVEPVQWPADLQAKWDASEAERHYAHVYYPGDTLP